MINKLKKKRREYFMTNVTFLLETLTCPSCMAKIEGALRRTKGVERAEVLFNASKAKITFEESIVQSEDLKKIIKALGFTVLGEK